MNNVIRIGVSLATVTVVAVWCHWYEPFHLVVGASAVALGMLLAFLWRKSRQGEGAGETAEADEVFENPFRPAVFGLMSGVFLCVLLWGMFAAAERIDLLTRPFEVQQRKRFDAQLSAAVEAGKHEQAVLLVSNRLATEKMSKDWRTNLVRQIYSELIELTRTRGDFVQRIDLLHWAGEVARTNHFDGRLAAELLAKAEEAQSKRLHFTRLKDAREWDELIPALKAETESKPHEQWELPFDRWLYYAYLQSAEDNKDVKIQKEKLRRAIETANRFGLDNTTALAAMRNVEKEESLAGVVANAVQRTREDAQTTISQLNNQIAQAQEKAKQIEEQTRRMRKQAFDERKQAELQARYEGLMTTVDGFRDPDPLRTLERKRDMYLQVYEFAKTNGLDLQPASSRLDQAERGLTELLACLQRENQPVGLPPGVRLTILRANAERFPPSIDLELLLQDALGQPLGGLRRQDFEILCAGQMLTNFVLAGVERRPPPLYVVVAIDCSGSMDKTMRAAIEGVQAMLHNLAHEERVYVRILTFSDKVQLLCDWTNDMRHAEATVDRVSAGGTTALFAAVESAVSGLNSCKGDRRLLLFTDGKNTVMSKLNLPGLAAQLSSNQIQAFAIGLRTADLDEKALKYLATASGGSYFMAGTPSEIAAQFLSARQQLRRAIYRFDLTPALDPETKTFSLRIKVGGSNAVVQATMLNKSQNPP